MDSHRNSNITMLEIQIVSLAIFTAMITLKDGYNEEKHSCPRFFLGFLKMIKLIECALIKHWGTCILFLIISSYSEHSNYSSVRSNIVLPNFIYLRARMLQAIISYFIVYCFLYDSRIINLFIYGWTLQPFWLLFVTVTGFNNDSANAHGNKTCKM